MTLNVRKDYIPKVRRKVQTIDFFKTLDAYTPEERLNLHYGSYGYNFMLSGGVLQTGIGLDNASYKVEDERVVLPTLAVYGERIKVLHYFRGLNTTSPERLIAFSNQGNFYSCSLLTQGEFTKIEGIKGEAGSQASFINYYYEGREIMLILYSGGVATYDGEVVKVFENTPVLTSSIMLYDRLFGISEDTLYFSAPLNPTDFSVENGGGSISFMDEGGALKKIIALGSDIYVFREFSIFKLSVIGSPSDYVLSRVGYFDQKFVPGTLQNVGNELYFMIGKCLYSFDGYLLKQIRRELTALIESTDYATATYFDLTYYLSCRIKTDDSIVGDEGDMPPLYNNGIIYVSTLTPMHGVLRGADVISFYPILTSKLKAIFVVYGNARSHRPGMIVEGGTLYGTPLKKLWVSPKVILGDEGEQTNLKRVYANVYDNVDITVTQEEKRVTRTVPKNSFEPVTFNTIGNDFRFEISTDGNLRIGKITFVFNLSRRCAR